MIKNTKSLQEQLDSEKEHHCKAESKLHHLQKEDKGKGKQREVSASCKWCEWESISNSDIAEQLLSKTSRKQRCNTGALDVPPRGMTAFPDAEPMGVGPHMVLPPVGSEQLALEIMVPTMTVIESELYSIFLSISPIFPAVLQPLFSLLPVMVRLLPYLVLEWKQRTFAARANNGHCDLSLHVILNIVDKLVS